MKAKLERFAYTPMGVFGNLVIEGKSWFTVERPWLDNRPQVSCIPEGNYKMGVRESGVVSRSTGGAYTRGWEVKNVQGRTFIMLHPGNTMDDLQGCIAPGKTLAYVKGKWAVGSSRQAFDEFMAATKGVETIDLEVVQYVP